MRYRLEMRCEGGGDGTEYIEADTLAEAEEAADARTDEWTADGDWGVDGARVGYWWELYDAGDEGDEPEELARGSGACEVAPDHESLILRAIGRRRPAAERCCGLDPDDHDWTSEGEGGCDENPGVWATGGTSFLFRDHCRACGLWREERKCGSQRNPGETDTTRYGMPEDWCGECEAEECCCDHKDDGE